MIWCLSNARSGDLHFGISFVALRALVREIIPNTIHTYPHTWPNSDFHRLFDSGFAPSALSLRLKKCFRFIFAFFEKSDRKTCIVAPNHDFFWFDLFHLVTWDDLHLYYGHKAQEIIPTYKCQWHYPCHLLALFALNIGIVLVDVTKLENSNILTLTWPVTSSVTSRSNFTPCLESSRRYRAIGWRILQIVTGVWEICNVWIARVQRGAGWGFRVLSTRWLAQFKTPL